MKSIAAFSRNRREDFFLENWHTLKNWNFSGTDPENFKTFPNLGWIEPGFCQLEPSHKYFGSTRAEPKAFLKIRAKTEPRSAGSASQCIAEPANLGSSRAELHFAEPSPSQEKLWLEPSHGSIHPYTKQDLSIIEFKNQVWNLLHKLVAQKGELILILGSKINNFWTIFLHRTKISLKILPEIQKLGF